MILFNTAVRFVQPSGLVWGRPSGLFFADSFLARPIPLSESGSIFSPNGAITGLTVDFMALSIVGALNELKLNILTVSGSSSSGGVAQLNGLSGFVTLVSPSGSVKISPDAASSQLRIDVDILMSGVPRTYSQELFPASVVFNIQHDFGTRNIIGQVYTKNPYFNPDADPVISVIKPISNNVAQVIFDDGVAASGFVVLMGGHSWK